MKATVVDLRYRMRDVLKALDRNEDVIILCHGKARGVIVAERPRNATRVAAHPFFNMRPDGESVVDLMEQLRGGRVGAL